MKKGYLRSLAATLGLMVMVMVQGGVAQAAEVLIYSNEVREENANRMILDNDDTGGDVILQFGSSLNEQLFWDTDGSRGGVAGAFVFTDDVKMEANLDVGGTLRVDSTGSNGYFELVNVNTNGDWDLVINNDGITADLLVTAADLKKIVDITSSAAAIDTAVGQAHDQDTDTGTTNVSFRVDSDATNGYVELTGNAATGDYDLTINNAGLTADLTITGGDLQKLADLTVTASEINAAVAQAHDQNTDTGTSQDSFVLNSDGDNATLQFGQNADGEITYNDTNDTFDFDGNEVINIADPTTSSSAATKNYVDSLVEGLYWRDPIEHPNQLVDGASGGIRSGGKIYVSDETTVSDGDLIVVSYNSGGSSFTLTAKDSPAGGCEFKSGAAATSNADMAASIFSAIGTCAGAADFSGQSSQNGDAVFLVHDNPGSVGDGSISVPTGIVKIDMHDGELYADLSSGETRISRSDDVAYTWNSDAEEWIAISGPSAIPDATETVKGIVELASDGETASGVAVQGSDSRLHDQNTDTGTSEDDFNVNSDGADGQISFGNTVDGYLTYTQSTDLFNFQGDADVDGNLNVDGTINGTGISSTGLDFNGNATIGTNDDTLALESSAWDVDASGNTTGLTIDADTNTITNLDFGDLGTRVKTIPISMNDLTIIEEGGANQCDLYSDFDTANNHQYYTLRTTKGTMQDLTMKIKVKLPEDFVDFSNANDLTFYYRNTGASNADSKVSIIVDDGTASHEAWDNTTVGTDMFSATWTTLTTEFVNTYGFAPSAGDYIYITVRGYTTRDGSTDHSPFMGEIYLTYTGR